MKQEGYAVDIVPDNRDPNNVNSHVKVAFEDILGEPSAVEACSCLWRGSRGTFNCCKSFTYKLLSGICGIPLAIYWGCSFAFVAFQQVWFCTPMFRLCEIRCRDWRRHCSVCMDAMLGPCCETCGLMFSRIIVRNES